MSQFLRAASAIKPAPIPAPKRTVAFIALVIKSSWRLSLAAVFVLFLGTISAQGQVISGVCSNRSATNLRTDGLRFSLDGNPTFIVLVSYFDAMHASAGAVERDLAFLKNKGVRGIRIFPLWIYEGQRADATLLDRTGNIRSRERWDHFLKILQTAAACGLVVDVTFNREMLAAEAPFGVADYQRGIAEVTARLKSLGMTHVFFDLQNERGHPNAPAMQLTAGQVRQLRDAVKRADPGRLVMMSTQGGVEESLHLAVLAKLDVIAFHEPQSADWHHSTRTTVEALKHGGTPVYLQEMARAPDRGVQCERRSPEVNPFLEAMREAEAAGAAAWTLHTDAAFRLDTQSFQTELASCPREIDFLDGLKR